MILNRSEEVIAMEKERILDAMAASGTPAKYEHRLRVGYEIIRQREKQLREAQEQLKKEQARTVWAMEKLHRALSQMKRAEDACQTCAHGRDPLPCAGDPEPVDLCDTCKRECMCKNCDGYGCWVWNGGGEQ